MASKHAVIGLVGNQVEAERIVAELQHAGFSQNDISALLPDRRGSRDFAHEQHTKAPQGAITGVGAGGAIGGTLGLLAGIGALAIPGLGVLIAAGPIMALLSGAAAGAAIGGIAGALVGMGIPEIEAKLYEGKIKSGNILLAVHVATRAERDRAKKLLEVYGAKDIVTIGEGSVPRKEKSISP